MANSALALTSPPRLRVIVTWSARTFFDRLVPAGLLGFAASSRLVALGHQVSAPPATTDPNVLALYQLGLVHHAVAFLFLALVSLLFLARRAPRGDRAGLLPFTVALLGTLLLSVPALYPRTIDDLGVLVASNVLTVSGLIFTLYAIGSLGTCFGIAPEARGLVTGGPYRMVRHPVYLGEFIAGLGIFLPVLAPWTALLFAVFCAVQLWRMRLEERALEAVFADYAEYRARTPALLPWPRPAC